MVSVVEHTIAVYFTTLPAPETSSIPLPYSETVVLKLEFAVHYTLSLHTGHASVTIPGTKEWRSLSSGDLSL